MPATSHNAAGSALGYQHQTWWALQELLANGADRPDAAISLELYDDVAWGEDPSPTQLLQVKHHQGDSRDLTDSSPDLWRTLKVWMDVATPGDPLGPELCLVTTQTASDGTAVAALRPSSRDPQAALKRLEAAATAGASEQTKRAREQFLALSAADRRTFVERVRVVDGSPHIQDVPALVRRQLLWALPIGHEDLFLALVWRWWDEQAVAMLRRVQRSVDVSAAHSAIADIRDRFTSENLPTLIELRDIDPGAVLEAHKAHVFVQQMQWIVYPPVNLQRAIVDYYRAYVQTVRWLDEDLIGLGELARFEAELVDEWKIEFEWMLETLDDDADEAVKAQAGKQMLRKLLEQTGISVRARYNEPFFVRGKRHILADAGTIGWHPDFEARVKTLLQVAP